MEHNYGVSENSPRTIKLGFLNVCNIKSKVCLPDFTEFIDDFDIFGCAETKLDSLDSIEIDNYKGFFSNRVNARNKSGGVCIFVKKTIIDQFTLTCCNDHCKECVTLCSVLDGVMWCVLGNILLGVVYVPPESSAYNDSDIFDKINFVIAELCSHFRVESVCLMGDFNARSGVLKDFIEPDESLLQYNMLPDYITDSVLRITKGDGCERVSDDHRMNNHGYKLIELCRNQDLRIVNGRFGPSSACNTCKNASVVDYMIVSTDLFHGIKSFEVLAFDPLLSDVHRALVLEVFAGFIECDENPDSDANMEGDDDMPSVVKNYKYIWNADNSDMFVDSINMDMVSKVEESLDGLLMNIDSIVNEDINNVYEDVCGILNVCADKSDMVKHINKSNNNARKNNTSKKWFSKECKEKRKEYHRCKSKHRMTRNDNDLQVLRKASKMYKRTVKKAIQLYEKRFNMKMRKLRTRNPKEFWKLLCSADKKDTANKIKLEVLTEYFKNLNIDKNDYNDNENVLADDRALFKNDFINNDFTVSEVMHVIKRLKCNKAAGSDLIVNEFLKATVEKLCPVLTKLFNVVFASGIVPEAWTQGLIVPIYKKKGEQSDPNNYRGISLLSCIGKVFTSLISERITKYVEHFELLGAEQAGFRKGYSTMDHTFVFYSLIQLYTKFKRKNLYCCFVDYRKAFDTIPRVLLWQKLLAHNINGKLFAVVQNLYNSAKSAVRLHCGTGPFFNSNIGVRQGDNLSPLLFALYLNDLQEFLSKAYNGLTLSSQLIQNYVQDDDTVVYLKLFSLLYADDTIILAESQYELQAALNGMLHYCRLWKLDVNSQKTKVVVFGNKRPATKNGYTFGREEIEIVSEYTYLGVLLKANGDIKKNISVLKNVASRAMYALLKKSRKLGLDIDVQLKLFDSVVMPVALYGCEIWGFSSTDIIEKLHLQFCKMILKVKKSTPTCMVYGELGRLPIQYNIDSRMLCFWFRTVTCGGNKFTTTFYKLMHRLHSSGTYSCKWIEKIKNTLSVCGLSHLWDNQSSIDIEYNSFKRLCKDKLKVYYNRLWLDAMQTSTKCSLYKEFKTELKFENYLNDLDVTIKYFLIRYRTSNHRLPIEQGRFNNIPRVDRKCTLCEMGDIGDEYHYMFVCSKFNEARKKFVKKSLYTKPSVKTFCDLIGSQKKSEIVKVAKFSKVILQNTH